MKILVILGGGESGVGAAILGKQKGYEIFVSDSGSIAKKYKKVLLHHEINFEEHQHSFNFGGSSIKSVASFSKSFGAETEKYHQLKMNKLPKVLQLFKK